MNILNIDRWLLIMLFHIFFNGPLLIYIGYVKPTDIYLYLYLLLKASTFLVYLLYKLYTTSNLSPWLYVHLILFMPLFIYVGYLGTYNLTIPNYLYEFLIAIGLGAIAYHLYKLKNYSF